MNSIKCKNCGLSNFVTDPECRRCRTPFTHNLDQGNYVEGKKSSSNGIIAVVIFSIVALAGYYMFVGFGRSKDQVNGTDANRVAEQPAQPQQPTGLSRAEMDRQRSQRVANAVSIGPGLSAHENRTQQTEQMMKDISNSASK